METYNLIAVEEICAHHGIDTSFVISLHQYGLLEIINIDDSGFIAVDELKELEKFIQLYYELDINMEGIETIMNLLHRITSMQEEISVLKNRLMIYEK